MRGGIDLGGTKVQAVVVNDRFAIKGEARRPTPTEGGPADVAAEMAAAMRSAAESAGVETSALEGVGVGSPGAVDDAAGTVADAGNLPNWREPFPLGPTLEEALGTPRLPRQRRRAGGRRRISLRRRPPVLVAARGLLGHRNRRRDRARRQVLARPRSSGRDRPHSRGARRGPLPLRGAGMRRGLRGPRGDGAARPKAGQAG